jgi:hypothetical protein
MVDMYVCVLDNSETINDVEMLIFHIHPPADAGE